MFGLQIVDAIVLLLYLVGITGLGIWSAKLVKTSGDYFMPRKFGTKMLVMHAFGSGTHSDQAVSVASKTFTGGLSGIWYQWLYLFGTPFYWLISPVLRRFRAITTADVYIARFDHTVAKLFTVVGILQLMVNIGMMLKGSGAVIATAFDESVSPDLVIILMTVMFVVYGFAGGLSAAIITDFIQGILTVIFSFLLLPFVLGAVGGLDGLKAGIEDPQLLSLVAPAEIGVFYIVILALNGLIGIVPQPHIMGNCAAGRTELDGRLGFTLGNFLKRVCTIAWTLTGLAGIVYFAGRELHPDEVFGLMSKEFLPLIFPGLLGVFLASLLASVMSSCDSFMIASSALFTENIYKPYKPGKSHSHYLNVGRYTSLFIVAGGVLFAYWLPGVVEGLEIFWKLASMMGICFWLGFFWRRANVPGAWAATMAGFFIWWLTDQAFFIHWLGSLPLAETLRFVVGEGGSLAIYLPWQMVFYLLGGFLFGIIVSKLTAPMDGEKLDRFYELVRTPVDTEEGNPDVPCTIPAHIPIPEKDKLFPKSQNLEILKPSKLSVVGFILSWIAVAFLIAIVYFLF